MNIKKLLVTSVCVASLAASGFAFAAGSEQIRAVGSSTVYPFTTIVAEHFGKSTGNKTPIVESVGTGGGFKLFCAGAGDDTPDIANASRAIKDSEKELCTKNGVNNPLEVKIGYDGIVVANKKGGDKFSLTEKQIFLALAKKIPVGGKLVDNTNKKWSDVDPKLPPHSIEVYGPPPTSGTRDAFAELVMVKSCKDLPEFKAAYADEKEREKACALIREDGSYIDSGENDNLMVQKLSSNSNALGIFGYSFLEENSSSIQGSSIQGVAPDFDNISSGKYPVSRPLFIYVKKEHIAKKPSIKDFVKEYLSKNALGTEGYLSAKGLIPLSESEFANVSKKVLESIK